MSSDCSAPNHHTAKPRVTIGVFGNRQIYEGMTIASYEHTLLLGIRAAARAYDCNLLLACGVGPQTAPFEWLPAWPTLLPSTNFVPVGPWNTDGLIAIPPFSTAQHAQLRTFLPPEFPLVFTSPQPGFSSVGPDNATGIAQAFAHLVGHGHQRIVFIAADAHPEGDGAERLVAYKQALATYGLAFDPKLVGYGGHNQHDSYDAIRQIIAEGTAFSAVLASNDESAVGALHALRDARLRVPNDVAVIGFDDVQHAKAQQPPLSTVRHPTFALGYQAVELLLEHIHGRMLSPTVVRIPTQLIIRESCGCQLIGAQLGAISEPSTAGVNGDTITLVDAMASAIAIEAPEHAPGSLHEQCRTLIAGWQTAQTIHGAQPFITALDAILQQLDTVDDIHGWQAAVTVLGQHTAHNEVIEQILEQARVRISDYVRRQHTRFAIREAQRREQLGMLTAQLLTAIEPLHLLEILHAHLPRLGIRHIHIAQFAASDGDPVAWSDVYMPSNSGELVTQRFASHSFPPPWLYNTNEPLHLALLPLIIEDGPSGFVAFDAADLDACGLIVRHIAAALRNSQLHSDAIQGRQMAEEANRLKSRFLSTVSHELRTPLNLIVGLSEMLLHMRGEAVNPADPTYQDLQRIFANAQHLGRLISDVLDLASSEAGQLRLYQEPLDLVEVLDVVAATGKQMATEKGLHWHDLLPNEPVLVHGDRTRLRQVVLNFVSNAIKFTDHGAVTLSVKTEHGNAIVAVSDTGPGVPRDDQPYIFDEFRSSERTADRGYGGLGLGLAICKQLIERHSGTIGIESSGEENSGARFFFQLPLIAALPTSDTAEQLVVCLTEHDTMDSDLQAIVHQHKRDMQVLRIDLVADWLPRLIAHPPGAIVLDQQLAVTRGWEIMAVLKHHSATTHIPVMMYAFDQHTARGSLLELDYLLKPLDNEQLARALEHQHDQPKSILIADDDDDTRALHTHMVEQHLPACRVFEARNGREAIRLLEHTTPDLVLLDLLMPELDGFGVLEAMRSLPATRDVPVVVLTAQILTQHDMERLNTGVAAILSKGLFSLEEIQSHVESALVRQRKLNSTMQQVVRQAIALIHSQYDQQITRDQLAADVGVSSDHLTASFRQEMGITPITYLNRYRISRARALLETTNHSVTEIAVAVGCPDLPNFSRLFHREVGMPPIAYRRAKKV